jgi:hypothetical protein
MPRLSESIAAIAHMYRLAAGMSQPREDDPEELLVSLGTLVAAIVLATLALLAITCPEVPRMYLPSNQPTGWHRISSAQHSLGHAPT